jgi:Abnormal spindle-like microcephaly-assoc'd, ASPM-SPD-2-Hydin
MTSHSNYPTQAVTAVPQFTNHISRGRKLLPLFAALTVILAIIGLSSCSGYTTAPSIGGNGGGTGGGSTGDPQAGVLSPSSTTVGFGNVNVGSTGTQSVTVTNTGTAAVNIASAQISGAGFTVIGGSPSASVPVGQSVTVQLQFAPTTRGASGGALTVTSDASNSPLSVSLNGTGMQPALTISPASLNFSNVVVGQTGTQTVTLTNSGNSSLTMNLATISGTGFGMSGLTLPSNIAAGANLQFNVTFTPTSTSGSTGSVVFTDNATGSPQTLTLAGSALASGSSLGSNPGSFNFNSVAVGQSSQQSFTLTNSGNATVTIGTVTASGTGFSASGLSAGRQIAAGASATVTGTFAPTAAGAATGTIVITSNATNPTLTITLSGTGTQGGLSANPASISFGSVIDGASASVPVTLTNTGTANVVISAHSITGTGFTLTGWSAPASLTPGQTTSFTVTFAPTTSGSATGSVSISSNAAGSPLSINLSGSGTATQATMTINPSPVAFGSVTVGDNSSQTVMLTNTGNKTLSVTAATISGSGFTTSLTAPKSVNAGANITFTVTFAPPSAGSETGSIQIASNAVGSPATISLSGTGLQAQAAASPSSVAFSNVTVGSNSSQPITLQNNGNTTLTFSKVTVAGTGMSITGLTTSSTIAAGGNLVFNAVFTPTAAGAVTGTVQLTTNGTPSTLTINLNGTGVATQSAMTINPSPVTFGNVNVGSSSNQTVTVTNSGNGTLNITAATISGTGFTMNMTAPTSVKAGASTQFTVTYAPTTEGSASGSISITSNASATPASISLSGTGMQAQVSASPTSASFSNVIVGNSNSQQITLHNNGNVTLTFSNIAVSGAGMSVTGLTTSSTIAAAGNLAFNAVFAPTGAGTVSGSIQLTTNGTPPSMTINLTGTGVAAAQTLSANPTSLSFGTQTVNTSSSQTSTLTNTGNANVTISGVTTTGAGFSTSGVANGTILTPGQTATLTVTFDPTTTGAVTGASVSVASNATNTPTTVSLAGTGQAAATQHSVMLSWDSSISDGVSGYNVYRSTTSSGFSSTPLNSSPVTALTYTDSTVTSGDQYFYVVTAVDGSEASGDSNEVSVTIP